MTPDVSEIAARLQAALGVQYRIERELGRGGMGLVFLARDTTLDRPVAVKVIHPDLATRQTVAQRFLAEARMIARLRHPNIVSVYTAGEATGIFYYVMDYVPGETLRERLQREGRLPVEEAVRIASDLAGALDAAGEAGLVHRDVKPENILLDQRDGRPLLVDFGVARVLMADSGAFITGAGVAVGTPTYMSPEQASGDEVDRRSDLYALGVVTYEMLAGRPPFRAPSSATVISMQLSERPVAVTKERSEVPARVGDAVMQALEKAPDDRWQTGADFRQALLGDLVRHRRGRSRALRWVAAAVIVLALGGAGILGLRTDGGPPAGVNPRHSLLILPFENLREDPAVAWLRDGSVSMLALTLSQWNDLSVVDQERVHDLLSKENVEPGEGVGLEMARRLAREAGVWTVVLGDYTQIGDSLILSARVYDVATGSRVNVATAEGRPGEDVRPLFDDLAGQLLSLSGAPGGLRPDLASVTTPSLEAYRSYLDGIDSLNHWSLEGADRELRQAIERDSTFGLAWYKLSLARGWLVGPADSLGRVAIQTAARYSDRVPAHDRTMINAYQAFLNGDFVTARGQYRSLLERDSTDADAWYGLGDAWFHDTSSADMAGNRTQSLRAFQRAIALDPQYALAYDHVATMLNDAAGRRPVFALVTPDSFVLNRRPDGTAVLQDIALDQAVRRARVEAVALTRRWVTTQPATPRARAALVDALVASESWPQALQEVQSLRDQPGSTPAQLSFIEGRIRFASGDVEGAVRTLRPLLDSTDVNDFDGAPATSFVDVNSAANVFSYIGDIPTANRALALGSRIHAAKMHVSPEDIDAFERWSRGMLYGPAGGSPGILKEIWSEAAEAARSAPANSRAGLARSGSAAALWLFLGPPHDQGALIELGALTDAPQTPEVQALVALRQQEDTARARRILGESPETTTAAKSMYAGSIGDHRPLLAEAYVLLGDYRAAIELLEDFEPAQFQTHGFDARWGEMGRVRLLRAVAFEKMGQREAAVSEYRALLAQLTDPHQEVAPYLEQARLGLARLQGAG